MLLQHSFTMHWWTTSDLVIASLLLVSFVLHLHTVEKLHGKNICCTVLLLQLPVVCNWELY